MAKSQRCLKCLHVTKNGEKEKKYTVMLTFSSCYEYGASVSFVGPVVVVAEFGGAVVDGF